MTNTEALSVSKQSQIKLSARTLFVHFSPFGTVARKSFRQN